MPKAIDPKVIELIKEAYLTRDDEPSLVALAKEFKVGRSTVTNRARAEKWADIRESQKEGKVKGAKQANRHRRIDSLTAIREAIADISGEVSGVEAKSKEGCATALVSLLKAERELFPPDADDLAELAVKLEITPADFIRALKTKWQEKEQQQQSA